MACSMKAALMISLRSTLLVHVIALGCSLKADAQETGIVSEQQAEASSIMQALGANMRALECFDMLMTEEKSYVAPEDNSGLQFTIRWRYICNFRERVHLIVASHRVHRFSLTTEEERHEQRFLGVFVNANERENWHRISSGSSVSPALPQANDAESFERWALHVSAFPDPRFVGSGLFPEAFVGEISIEEAFRNMVSPAVRMTLDETGEKNRLLIVKTYDGTPSGPGVRYRSLMDMERFVPLRLEFAIIQKEDGKIVPKTTERIVWDDLEGTMVPLEIHGERLVKHKREWKEPILESYDVVFTWNSVNECDKLPDVDKSILSNSEAILRLLGEDANAPDVLNR